MVSLISFKTEEEEDFATRLLRQLPIGLGIGIGLRGLISFLGTKPLKVVPPLLEELEERAEMLEERLEELREEKTKKPMKKRSSVRKEAITNIAKPFVLLSALFGSGYVGWKIMDKLIDKIRLRRLKDEAIEVREKIQKLREELGIPTSQTEIELLDKQGFVKQAMSPLQFYFTLAATLAAAGFLMTNEALNYMSGETALRKALKKRIEERNLELAREEQSPMVTLRSYLELI